MAGTYTSAEHEKTTLTINQDGTFVYNPYGSGTYKVDGSNIAMTNPMWGATTGKIEGGTLVFPEGLNKFGKTFMGTWVRQ